MYPKYPVSAILPDIKYPLVSWYPWHSRVGSGVSGAGGMRGVNVVHMSLPFSPHDPPPRAATTLATARLPALDPIADGVVVVGAGLSGVVRGRGNSSGLVTVLALVRRGLQGYKDGMLTSVGVGVETGGDGLGLGVATGRLPTASVA